MRRILPLVILLYWTLAYPGMAAEHDQRLLPFTAEYELTRNGIAVGRTQVSLELLPDGVYLYRASTAPNPVLALLRTDRIREESRGRMVQGRPRPDRYLYRREGSDIERHLELEFDWTDQRVRNIERSSTWSMQVPKGTLDKLVQQLVFTLDLKNGRKTASYPVADGGRLKEYSYRTLGKETLSTRLGRFDTLKVNRAKDQGATDYTLWLAPALGFRPVRILRRHGGSQYRMELVELDLKTH